MIVESNGKQGNGDYATTRLSLHLDKQMLVVKVHNNIWVWIFYSM